jgi:hypothetical protein
MIMASCRSVRVASSLRVGPANSDWVCNGILGRPAAGQANLGGCHLVLERVAAKRLLATQTTQGSSHVAATSSCPGSWHSAARLWTCRRFSSAAAVLARSPGSPAPVPGYTDNRHPSAAALPPPTSCRAISQDSHAAHGCLQRRGIRSPTQLPKWAVRPRTSVPKVPRPSVSQRATEGRSGPRDQRISQRGPGPKPAESQRTGAHDCPVPQGPGSLRPPTGPSPA